MPGIGVQSTPFVERLWPSFERLCAGMTPRMT